VEEEEEEAEGFALPKPLTVLAPVPAVPELFLDEGFFAWRAVEEKEKEVEVEWGDTGRKAWSLGRTKATRKRRGTAE